jgi:hypothetical protein
MMAQVHELFRSHLVQVVAPNNPGLVYKGRQHSRAWYDTDILKR